MNLPASSICVDRAKAGSIRLERYDISAEAGKLPAISASHSLPMRLFQIALRIRVSDVDELPHCANSATALANIDKARWRSTLAGKRNRIVEL